MPSANDLPRTGQTSASHDVEAQIKQLREDIAALTRSVAALGNEKAGEVRGTARRAAADAADASKNKEGTADTAVKGNEKAAVIAAHDEAEADIEKDPDMELPTANDDLDEGELANLGGDKNDLV